MAEQDGSEGLTVSQLAFDAYREQTEKAVDFHRDMSMRFAEDRDTQKHRAREAEAQVITLTKERDDLRQIALEQDTVLSQLKEENAQLKAGWQAIETAPKDGTELLLWDPHDGSLNWSCLGMYVDFESVGGAPEGCHSGWYDSLSGYTELHPTHWMPLPEAPST